MVSLFLIFLLMFLKLVEDYKKQLDIQQVITNSLSLYQVYTSHIHEVI